MPLTVVALSLRPPFDGIIAAATSSRYILLSDKPFSGRSCQAFKPRAREEDAEERLIS